MKAPDSLHIQMIPVDRINIINPRIRSQRIFREIVGNIDQLGLKRPITVSRRSRAEGTQYDLICGQGRLEAFRTLKQSEIPALVVDADTEDCLIMSLVENCARRQHRAIDLLHDIGRLKDQGYKEPEIARKIGLSQEYVRGVLRLLQKGEHRLVQAMESGHIPVSVAIEIAESDDASIQQVLQSAYEKKLLRGKKLLIVKRLLEQRRRRGKGLHTRVQKRGAALSTASLLRTYREDADKKRLLIRKAEATRGRLIFVTEALRKLLADEHFVTLLRAEGLDTLPKGLADRMAEGGRVS